MKNFNNYTTDFSARNAYWLARSSEIVYMDQANADIALIDLGMTKRVFIDRQDTQAFIALDEDKMIISVRGTDSLADAMTNIKFSLIDSVGGKVHEGFNIAAKHIWKDIVKLVRENNEKTLWITGHSLGAGIATIITAKLVQENHEFVNGLYTFGQPRTGNRQFAKNFNRTFGRCTFRYVNNNDVVTRTPFRAMKYRHIGTLQYFDESGKLHNKISWWMRLLDRLHGRVDDLFVRGLDGWKDHAISNYVDITSKMI